MKGYKENIKMISIEVEKINKKMGDIEGNMEKERKEREEEERMKEDIIIFKEILI